MEIFATKPSLLNPPVTVLACYCYKGLWVIQKASGRTIGAPLKNDSIKGREAQTPKGRKGPLVTKNDVSDAPQVEKNGAAPRTGKTDDPAPPPQEASQRAQCDGRDQGHGAGKGQDLLTRRNLTTRVTSRKESQKPIKADQTHRSVDCKKG